MARPPVDSRMSVFPFGRRSAEPQQAEKRPPLPYGGYCQTTCCVNGSISTTRDDPFCPRLSNTSTFPLASSDGWCCVENSPVSAHNTLPACGSTTATVLSRGLDKIGR